MMVFQKQKEAQARTTVSFLARNPRVLKKSVVKLVFSCRRDKYSVIDPENIECSRQAPALLLSPHSVPCFLGSQAHCLHSQRHGNVCYLPPSKSVAAALPWRSSTSSFRGTSSREWWRRKEKRNRFSEKTEKTRRKRNRKVFCFLF